MSIIIKTQLIKNKRIVVIPSKRRHSGPGYRMPASPPKAYLQTVRLFVKRTVLQDEVCF